MRFSCAKNILEDIINTTERFTGKNINLPILGNLLFEAEKNKIRVTATNLEVGIQALFSANVVKEGKISVPAKVIVSFVQSVPEDTLEFEGKGGNLFIKTGTRETKINGVSPDDFPLPPKIKKTSSCVLTAPEFRDGLARVLPAVSTSDFKPELNGVFFNFAAGSFQLVATDTFRLAEYGIRGPKKGAGDSFSCIIPLKTAQEISRLLDKGEEITLSVGENQMVFETNGYTVVTRLIEGKFPEYAAIIPKSLDTTSFVNRDALVNAVRASSIFASKLQEVTLEFGGSEVKITSMNLEVGEYKTKLPAATTGSDVSVSFNYRYLLDGLLALDEEEIFIGCNSETTPALLRNKSRESLLYVLMPIRLT